MKQFKWKYYINKLNVSVHSKFTNNVRTFICFIHSCTWITRPIMNATPTANLKVISIKTYKSILWFKIKIQYLCVFNLSMGRFRYTNSFCVFSRYFECLLYPNGMWRHFNRSTIYIAPLPEGAPWRCRLGCEHDTLRLLLLRPHAGTQPIRPTCTPNFELFSKARN